MVLLRHHCPYQSHRECPFFFSRGSYKKMDKTAKSHTSSVCSLPAASWSQGFCRFMLGYRDVQL